MPSTSLLMTTCLSLALFATAANAQNARQMMQQIDSNGDSMIQFSELQSFRARVFDQFDRDGDGIADPAELTALAEQSANNGRSGPANLDPYASDTNMDGVITREEFASYIPPRTLGADSNGDGALSRSELRALR